jgi:hypothetical protein
MATATTTTMTYASFPHPGASFAPDLDENMGPLSPTSSVAVDEGVPFDGTGIEGQAAVRGLKGLIASTGGGGGGDFGIGIGGHFVLSPSSPVKERSRRATMPGGFKPSSPEVLTPIDRVFAFLALFAAF